MAMFQCYCKEQVGRSQCNLVSNVTWTFETMIKRMHIFIMHVLNLVEETHQRH